MAGNVRLWRHELTDDHVHPFHPAQNLAILDNVLVCRQKDLEVAGTDLGLQRSSLGRVTLVSDHLDSRSPLRELAGPVRHCGQRHNDQVGSALAFGLDQEGDERNSLDGFSETLRQLSGL